MDADVVAGRDELVRQRLDQALKESDELREKIAQLEILVKQLQGQLGMNSKNSSIPPSKDSFGRPSTQKSLRQKTGRAPGKQAGTAGRWLQQIADPDETVCHEPASCDKCGTSLADCQTAVAERRQVFDIPPIRRVVTEHQVLEKVCSCGHRNRGVFPAEAPSYVSYGPNVRAVAVYAGSRQHVPLRRSTEFLNDVFGIDVSEGWVGLQLDRAQQAVIEPLKTVRAGLVGAPVLHCDETVCRVEGKKRYVHVACTGSLTLFHGPAGRGNEAMNAFGILPDYKGVMVHDGLVQYRKYNTEHGLCNAHHLRELTWVAENTDQSFAKEMIALLMELYQAVKDHKEQSKAGLGPQILKDFRRRYDELIRAGMDQHPPESARKSGKVRSLVDRLHDYVDDVLRFATDFRVPFDNNLAEQAVRMVKVQEKISGGWRTDEGATAFLNVRSYVQTAIKQSKNPMEAIRSLFTATPWVPAIG